MKAITAKKAVVCLLVVVVYAAIGVSGVVEKTREDEEHRRHVFMRNRTESKHQHSTKRPAVAVPTETKHEVSSAPTRAVQSHFHEGGPVRSPARFRNHR